MKRIHTIFLLTDMKILTGRLMLIGLIFLISVLWSCEKTGEIKDPPRIEFIESPELTFQDSVFSTGQDMSFGIRAFAGSGNITNITIKKRTDTALAYLDTGMNTSYAECCKTFIKGFDDEEEWIFTVMDIHRMKASISLKIVRDTSNQFSVLKSYPEIIMGAQKSSLFGSFFSLKDTSVFFPDEAFLHQERIDFLYYFGDDMNTISSPGANIEDGIFPGPQGLDQWSVQRESRLLKMNIVVNDFESMQNDSMLIALFNEPESKRKAKNLASDDIYFFQSPDNLLGAFRVLEVNGQDTGIIRIALKIQDK